MLQHYSVPSSEIEQQKAVQKLLEDANKSVRLEIYDQRTINFTLDIEEINKLIDPSTGNVFVNRQGALNYIASLIISREVIGYELLGDVTETIKDNKSNLNFLVKEVMIKSFTTPKKIFI